MQGFDLEGAEGRVELRWGSGFGGACAKQSAVRVAQGQIPACHTVAEDGTQHWEQMYKELAKSSFGARAYTKDASQQSADVVLSILATLAFDPAALPPTPSSTEASPPLQPNEFIVDNASARFWPRGNWYFFDGGKAYGQDCLVALPGYESAPGFGASAEARPELAQAGLYEVYGWWCGNPNYDQTRRGTILVHRSAKDPSPEAVGVDYQQGAGDWQSLGRYNLQPGAYVEVKSAISGNVVADAFRFVRVGEAGVEAAPTPLPTGPLVSNNPPSPLQQVAAGDLASRLGLDDPFYVSVPITPTETTFNDCATFPRDSCGGTRPGWEVIAAHGGITLTYRVSSDYKLMTIEGAEQLDPWVIGQTQPQRVFLRVSGGGANLSVQYQPDNTWHLLAPSTETTPPRDALLTAEQAAVLRDLSPKYGTLTLPVMEDGSRQLVFYGLGREISPSDADRAALQGLAAQLAAPPP
jgi:hypothetical protein